MAGDHWATAYSQGRCRRAWVKSRIAGPKDVPTRGQSRNWRDRSRQISGARRRAQRVVNKQKWSIIVQSYRECVSATLERHTLVDQSRQRIIPSTGDFVNTNHARGGTGAHTLVLYHKMRREGEESHGGSGLMQLGRTSAPDFDTLSGIRAQPLQPPTARGERRIRLCKIMLHSVQDIDMALLLG